MSIAGRSFDEGIFWVNQNDLDTVGEEIPFHKHPVPHSSGTAYGEAEITLKWADGRVEAYMVGPADQSVHVPAGVEHRIICTKAPARTNCRFLHYSPITKEPVERFQGVMFQKPDV